MSANDLRKEIESALIGFKKQNLRESAIALFNKLGYASERTLDFGTSSDFLETFDADGSKLGKFEPATNWKDLQLIFQLTSPDIAKGSAQQLSLLEAAPADLSDRSIESYLFFALELNPQTDGKPRPRTELCDLARAINRLFPMPALVLFKEGDKVSIAITYRRVNKRERTKDVVDRKVTLIRDVSITRPHPGHLAILEDFSLPALSAYRKRDIKTFTDLDNAWRESLSVELLRKRAYQKLADWYFWAREHATFPPDAPLDSEGKPSLPIIRLLTRVIFCWFVKEKTLPDGRPLIPYELFDAPRIRDLLKDASPEAPTYYTAILQNLFFATLNTEMDVAGQPPNRRFAEKKPTDHMVHTLWRHREQLRDPDAFASLVRDIPFLNGGLFECLDDRVEKSPGSTETIEVRVDGFSTNPNKAPHLPNFLFFGGDVAGVNLSEATGNSQRSSVTVTPLLDILNGFVWTITENTPLEEEVALDPDLLGNVFENLLAAYNPETGTVARNATGSFYTPDYVVDWMIDQALEPLLLAALPKQTKKNAERLGRLLDWDEPGHDFNDTEAALLVDALSRLRALDPACGSGAFPMGLLKKIVRVLSKLDSGNKLWKARQIALAEQLESATAREEALAAIDRAFSRDNDDYGRKLYLIENSIYGVDIQPLAVQIAKLRFFITLIVDQHIDPARPNYGILPLPNLETKIVPANTLLGLQRGQLLLGSDEVRRLERELKAVRHRYFTARRYSDKKTLRKRDRELCRELARALTDSGECTPADANRLVEWNPYNTNTHAGFFDPGWMFGLEGKNGTPGRFDLVLGNPPYVRQEELKAVTVRDSAGKDRPLKDVLKEQYQCFTGTADLYVYFFERSLQLLRPGGVLSFITSNKYFRAAYGEKLRAHLLYSTKPRAILDFGDTNIFTAVAYPCILVTEKTRDVTELPDPKRFESDSGFTQLVEHADHEFPVFAWKPGPSKVEFPSVFDREHFSLRQRDLRPSGWRLESPVGMRLLERLRKTGTPLGEYCQGRFYRGVLTGYNEAFVVDRETRDRLIAEHPSSAEVLKPFLRGRDVKRWRCESKDLWLIFTRRGIDIGKYPAIHAHLKPMKARLTPGGSGGRKPGSYEWYEIQDNIAYWQEFEQPKIVVPAIQDHVKYAPEYEGYFSNDKTSIIVPPSVPFMLAILNSQISWWITQQEFASKQGGFFEFKPMYVSKLPIPSATPEQKSACEALATSLVELHKPVAAGLPERGLMVSYFEQWLNGLVYELFFPAELHARNLHLFDETAKPENQLPDLNNVDAVAKFEKLKTLFQRVYDIKHPIREMLFSLRSIEEVRIIEGEA
jgi:hypothetical protein